VKRFPLVFTPYAPCIIIHATCIQGQLIHTICNLIYFKLI